MNKLYDLGYQEIKELDLLEQVCLKLDAVILDVRFNPQSRNPRWARYTLARRLIQRYVHVKSLGNENYKGGLIKIANLGVGLVAVRYYLENNPVILMCACADRPTCHRLTIVQEVERKMGITSEPLSLEKCRQIAEDLPVRANPPAQMTMFGE